MQHYNATLTLPPPSVDNKVREICSFIGEGKLCTMFKKVRAVVLLASCKLLTAGVQCFPNTLETTTQMLHDGTTWVITGDIPLMWMRDSSAQVNQYLPLAPSDPYIQIIIEGLIRRQIRWIHLDPYGSSYRLFLDFDHVVLTQHTPTTSHWFSSFSISLSHALSRSLSRSRAQGKNRLTDWDFKSGRTIHVAMHNYEIDSLCYFVKLSYDYWKLTGISDIFDEQWKSAVNLIIKTWRIEQDHSQSQYRYPELRFVNGNAKP